MEKRSSAVECLNSMVTEPYYMFHFLAFFSYFAIRTSTAHLLLPHIARHLLHREIQAVLTFSVLIAFKMAREDTWEAIIADTLFFGKVFLVVLALIVDYHLAFCYIMVFVVIYILTQQPAYQGLGTCSKLTPLQLEAILTEGNTSRLWLVEFCASSSSACISTSRCFPELSITYSTKNLSFGIVDLGLFPNAAAKFGISLSGSMSQLPTYILFENAAEVTRLPGLDFEFKVYRPTLTKKLLCKHFELDRLLVEYINGK